MEAVVVEVDHGEVVAGKDQGFASGHGIYTMQLGKSQAIALLGHYVTQSVTFEQPGLTPLEALRRVLSRPMKERTVKTMQFLINFTKGIKFFAELGEETHYQCCLHMTYHFTPSDTVLFHQGDPASQFFVLLNGKCSVLITDSSGAFTEVKVYHTGDSFGELALMKNQPRAATIFCQTDCHFGVLDREDFLRIIGKIKEAKLQRKIEFLQKFDFLQHWTKSSLFKLSYYFTERGYRRKQVVFHAGDDALEVYFITKGQFQLLQTVQFPGALNTLTNRLKSTSITAEITVLTEDQCFGEEDILDGSRRKFTCVCKSEKGEVLVISKEDFVKRVNGEETVNLIRKMKEKKLNFRMERLKAVVSIENMKRKTPVVSPMLTPINSPTQMSIFSNLVHYHKHAKMDALTLAIHRFDRETRQTQHSESPEMRHRSPPSLYPNGPIQSFKIKEKVVRKKTVKRTLSTGENSDRVVNIHTARMRNSRSSPKFTSRPQSEAGKISRFQAVPMSVVSLESRQRRRVSGWVTER